MATRYWLGKRLLVSAAVFAASAVAMGACGSEEGPPRSTTGPSSGAGGQATTTGAGGTSTGPCEEGTRKECKVTIDENNCFVGEQQCVDGEWGDCLDPENLDSLANGPISGCTANPCNPWCQQFGNETPGAPITAAGSAAPAGGPINGLPSSWQAAGVNEPCASAADCQFDTYCDLVMVSPTYQKCVPWPYDGFDAAITTMPDLTAPVQCDSSYVTMCNRADYTIPPGTDIEIATLNANSGDFGTCVPTSGLAGVSCVYSGGMGPGECVNVPGCTISGTTNIYVNADDPPGTAPGAAIAESSCNNNWSVFHSSSGCSCTNVSSSGSLSQVNMYMLLDNSGSMAGSTQGCNQSWCTDSWDSSAAALASFVTSAAADTLRMQFNVYDIADARCDTDAQGGTCNTNHANAVAGCEVPLFAVDYLTGTHDTDIAAWLNNDANDPPYPYVTQTPHAPALEAAANVVSTWNSTTFPGQKNVIVYISDGAADNCGADTATVAGKVTGVESYTVALPGSSITLLDAIAFQGGTGSAIDLRAEVPGPGLNTAVRNALIAIQAASASCVLTIPNVGQVDLSALNISWTPSSGPPAVPMTEVANLAACDPAPAAGVAEYYLTPPASPTEVELCPAACADAQADITSTIDILGDCIGGYAPTTSMPIAYEAECSGIGTGQPVWEFLYYDTTQIGDSSIEFEIRTGNDAAEANSGPWTSVAIADVPSPDALGGSPINLAPFLGPLVQQPFLQLRFIINPVTGGTASPELNDWSLQFSCLDSQ